MLIIINAIIVIVIVTSLYQRRHHHHQHHLHDRHLGTTTVIFFFVVKDHAIISRIYEPQWTILDLLNLRVGTINHVGTTSVPLQFLFHIR